LLIVWQLVFYIVAREVISILYSSDTSRIFDNSNSSTGPSRSTESGEVRSADENVSLVTPPVASAFNVSSVIGATISPTLISSLERPVLLFSGTSVSTPFSGYQVWTVVYNLFTDPYIQSKWQYFKHFRATVNLRLEITTTAAAYGALLIGYWYNAQGGSTRSILPTIPNDLIAWAYQRNSQVLDIHGSGSVLLSIPYSYSAPYWDIHNLAAQNAAFPVIFTLPLCPLLDASTGASATYSYAMHAWFSDVVIDTPLPVINDSSRSSSRRRKFSTSVPGVTTEEHEASTGFVSASATAVSSFAASLANVPVIGPFARAAEIGGSAIAGIARIFGFSRPLDRDPHTTVGTIPYSPYLLADQSRMLSLDPSSSISLCPQMFGDDGDALTFKNILQRPGIILIYTFAVQTTAELFFPVSPGYIMCNTTASPFSAQFTPLAFGTIWGAYWRGSLKYTFTFFASRYHRGRFRVSWSPCVWSYNDATASNRTLNHVVDLTSSTTIELTVHYMSRLPYLPCVTTSTQTSSFLEDQSNGFLYLSSVDYLQAPNASAPVTVIVSVTAGDDFELLGVNSSDTAMCHRDTYSATAETVYSNLPVNLLTPTAGYISSIPTENSTDFITNESSVVAADENYIQNFVTSVTFGSPSANRASEIYGGERFTSFRPLCKRTMPSIVIPTIQAVGNNTVEASFHCVIPPEPSQPLNYAAVKCQIGSSWTPIGWFGMAFKAIRGSVRITFQPVATYNTTSSAGSTSSRPPALVMVNRSCDLPLSKYVWTTDSSAKGIGASIADGAVWTNFFGISRAFEVFDHGVGQAISVTVPQNGYGYICTYYPKNLANSVIPGVWYAPISIGASGTAWPHGVIVSYAAGEDYNFVTWNGVPYINFYNFNQS
jgi:hypothetical protein